MRFILNILALNSILVFTNLTLISAEPVSEPEYNKIKSELKYDDTKWGVTKRKFDIEKPDYETPDIDMPDINTSGLTSLKEGIIYLVITILGFFILVIIFNLLKGKKIMEATIEEQLDQMEDIKQVNLDSLMDKALKQNNYRLALRIRFLEVLKYLTNEGLIEWHAKKTNRAYLREMSTSSLYSPYNTVSSIFERAWYGNIEVSKEDFQYFKKESAVFFESDKTLSN